MPKPKTPYVVRDRQRKETIAVGAIPLLALAIVGNRLGVPWGPFLYLACFCATYLVQDQMDPRYERYQQYNQSFKHPIASMVWHTEEGRRWQPAYIAAQISAIIASLSILIPQPLPGASWPFIFAICMAYAAGRRQMGCEGEPWPPVLATPATVSALGWDRSHWRNRWIPTSIAAILGAAIAWGVPYWIISIGHAWRPSPSVIKAAHYINIHLDHFTIGPLHLWQQITITVCGAGLAGYQVLNYLLFQSVHDPFKEQQKTRMAWEQRWEAALGNQAQAPLFKGEVKRPANEPTHVIAVFQAPPGSSFTQYEKMAGKLATSLGPDMVLIAPMAALDQEMAPIPGTAQALGFTVTYATGSMGDRPWARTDLDEKTLEFATQWGFKRAFSDLKLGSPYWAGLQILSRPGPSDPPGSSLLVESLWRLPQGIPYDNFVAKTMALQEKMDVPWLRIGRRPKAPGWASELVSVVWGERPAGFEALDPDTQFFIDSLGWEYAMRACNLVGADGQLPEFEGSEATEMGLRAHTFSPAFNLPWEKVQNSRPALVPTLGARYVQVEPTDTAGGFRIILGDTDPLDKMYLFRDYAHEILKTPTDQPQIAFYVGIGADGAPIDYVFDDEAPHTIISGASLALSTPLLKTDGSSTTMFDIQQGDQLYDDQSRPCNVTHVYKIYTPVRCYRLRFNDGTYIDASDTHQWMVTPFTPFNATPTLLTTQQICDRLYSEPATVLAIPYAPPIYDSTRVLIAAGAPNRYPPATPSTTYRHITSCDPIPLAPMRCIGVDSSSHLYLAGDQLVPTHNSGMGKMLSLDTPIPRQDGTDTSMGAIQIGDQIYDDQSRPCNVTHVYDIETPARCFQIEFDNGSDIRASDTHRWMVWDTEAGYPDTIGPSKTVQPSVYTTQQLYDNVMSADGPNRFAIKMAPPLPGVHDFDLPVDSYTLGVWLSGGRQTEAGDSTYIEVRPGDQQIIEEIRKSYLYLDARLAVSATGTTVYKVTCGDIDAALAHLGMLNSGPRRIPVRYMVASILQRRSLLQGLMDIGGVAPGQDSQLGSQNSNDLPSSFVSVDRELVDDVYRLVRSLGIKASVGSMQSSTGLVWGVSCWTGIDDAPFRLHEKSALLPMAGESFDDRRWHLISEVIPIETIEMRCIEVDSPSHMYLCGADLVPTHNSAQIHSLVLQMATKNTPQQWELRIAEPKNELQRYKSLPHVTRFVDMRTPGDNIFAPVADMLEELRIEMERRYDLFLRLPTRPSKLSQALVDPGLNESLPYIHCLIEECADYFVEPKMKDQKEDYVRLMYSLEWLSRKSRGAGIYLIVCTQRPTKNNLPTQVKANSRKIGFGTSTGMDSMIIIDQPGLEEIHTKGRGLVSAFKGYRGFRGFFLDDSPGGKNDLQRFLIPMCVLSEDRPLGAVAGDCSRWPVAPAAPVAV